MEKSMQLLNLGTGFKSQSSYGQRRGPKIDIPTNFFAWRSFKI